MKFGMESNIELTQKYERVKIQMTYVHPQPILNSTPLFSVLLARQLSIKPWQFESSILPVLEITDIVHSYCNCSINSCIPSLTMAVIIAGAIAVGDKVREILHQRQDKSYTQVHTRHDTGSKLA